MREIKFRAWDIINRSWVANDQFAIDLYGYRMYISNGKVLENIPTDGITLMQYTGLKDKNGVEIYEGDIVQGYGWDNMVVEYGIQEVDAFEGMGFNLWSFFDDDGNGYKANGKRLSSTYEVIGNIYENPELLEGGDK